MKRLKGTQTEESKRIGLAFNPQSNDVFITTFPKTGTTWVTMMLHSLRSRGDMNFEEITEVLVVCILPTHLYQLSKFLQSCMLILTYINNNRLFHGQYVPMIVTKT